MHFPKKSLDHDRLSSNDFFYENNHFGFYGCESKILEHEPMQIEEMEELLYEKYDLSQDNIQWMTVEDFMIENLGEEKVHKATFTISKDEMEEFAERKLSESELTEVLSLIENDEWIWEAIEDSKKEALAYISQK